MYKKYVSKIYNKKDQKIIKKKQRFHFPDKLKEVKLNFYVFRMMNIECILLVALFKE